MKKAMIVCEVENCPNKAKYNLYRFNSDGSKTWLNVCAAHEREIGDSNMRRAGGRYEREVENEQSK